jgi:lipopolysaccharide/colanic/teichoic acid biosynthesis glycosyltransferase
MAGLSLTTTNLDGLPIIGLRESAHFGLNLVVKRCMDIVFALIGLIILSPLFATIAILVKWSSPGPVFYRQVRCGLNGLPFNMLKFRTMPVDAEAATGPVWAAKNDPRRTKLGTFLRTSSIDELPQLINVFIGDMTLVGPRPERPHFILHRAISKDDSQLHGSAQSQSGHYRLGSGAWIPRQHLASQASAVRLALHHALDPLARY